jgi:hypothetical protein
MKTQFDEDEVEIMFRIMRDYIIEREVNCHDMIDLKIKKLFERLTLIRGVENEHRFKK